MADAADSKSVAADPKCLQNKALTHAENEVSVTATVTAPPTDPRLARIVEAWTTLPEAVRLAVLAVVNSAEANG